MTHWLDKVITLLQASTSDLRELARIAGGNPKIFYRGIYLHDLDVDGQNLEGMEFSEPPLTHENNQLAFDLKSGSHKLHDLRPDQAAKKIMRAPRQEERAALLLAEFLRDRTRGMEIIERYARDKAQLTDSVLRVLKEIRQKEVHGKKRFSNFQIARKVSGRFARTVEKRAILVYFLAKYLSADPEIKTWLRGRSLGWLSKDKKLEVQRILEAPPR